MIKERPNNMSALPAFEGKWEDVLSHSDELSGRRVRLFILSEDDEPFPGVPLDQRPSDGASLLKYAGTWAGDDIRERLDKVYETRSQADF